jgi:hypothetical protein
MDVGDQGFALELLFGLGRSNYGETSLDNPVSRISSLGLWRQSCNKPGSLVAALHVDR